MYKRWQGNSGEVCRVEERREPPPPPPPPGPGVSPPPPPPPFGFPLLGRLEGALGALETEDLLLMAILYLLYRESGDRELLIMMGAMYLL